VKALQPPTERFSAVALAALLAATGAWTSAPATAAAPVPPSSPTPRFVNVAAAAGLTLVNVCGKAERTTIDETVGNGVCLYDVDDDGKIDVFIPNGSRAGSFPPG
jgi:enediyne biosynthesis protein E4